MRGVCPAELQITSASRLYGAGLVGMDRANRHKIGGHTKYVTHRKRLPQIEMRKRDDVQDQAAIVLMITGVSAAVMRAMRSNRKARTRSARSGANANKGA